MISDELARALDALAHDPDLADRLRPIENASSRALALERAREFQQLVGHELPPMLVALGSAYRIGELLSDREINRWPRDFKLPSGELYTFELHRLAEEREYRLESLLRVSSSGTPEAIRAWVVEDLVPICVSDSHHFCLDYRFDPDRPPMIEIDTGVPWSDRPGRFGGTMNWAADDFEAFLQLPLHDFDNFDLLPVDPPTERQRAWIEWRDRFWSEVYETD